MEKENLFALKPSEIPEAGVGCFALSPLEAGIRLNSNPTIGSVRFLPEHQIPDEYLKYCPLGEDGLYMAPTNFIMMSVFWYINHAKEPNTDMIKGKMFANRSIEPGEELTLYYPDLLTHPKNKLWVRPEHI